MTKVTVIPSKDLGQSMDGYPPKKTKDEKKPSPKELGEEK